MLIYDLEKREGKPIYEYLYCCIKKDILRGVLKPGEKLPSKRELARDHKIALITVENAYAQLIIEGYVVAKEKSGYFVSAQELEDSVLSVRDPQENLPIADSGKKEDSAAMKAAGGEIRQREWLVDFSSSQLRADAFPFATWSKLLRRVMDEREDVFLQKPESIGVLKLRENIAMYLKKAKGLDVSADRILVGPGTEYLHHVILQLLGRSRIVAVEDPGYKKVGQIYEGNGLKCLHIPVDEYGLMVGRLVGSNAGLVHISPSHHFPTGCVMPIGRRKKLLEWARSQGAYLVEDDYDSEFRFDGRPVPTLASLDDETVIYMNTFTKTLAPSIRMAYMVLPEKLKDLYDKKLSYYSGSVSSFEQYTLAAFIGEGYYERHINRMRNYYRQQRTKILTTLQESSLAERVSVEEHAAGLHFILKVTGIRDDAKWLKKLEAKRIRLNPVSAYCYGTQEKYRHQFVIYYSDLDLDNLKEAFEIMAKN